MYLLRARRSPDLVNLRKGAGLTTKKKKTKRVATKEADLYMYAFKSSYTISKIASIRCVETLVSPVMADA